MRKESTNGLKGWRNTWLSTSCVVVTLALAALGLTACASQSGGKVQNNPAVVDAKYIGSNGAIVNGNKMYKTIQSALDDAPSSSKTPYLISIRNGRYYEKIVITKPFIALAGEDRDKTILTFDAYSGLAKPGGSGTWGTFACATLIVRATDFSAENMTIENGYDYPANDVKDKSDPTYTNDPQAVALMTDTGSDRALFRNVKVTGYQDTLFTNVGRTYFVKSLVSGNVDFIFGAGQTVFYDSDIITRPRAKPGVNPIGYVTAPSTQLSNKYGMVFINCRLKKENDKVPVASSPLGRPWHPTTTMPDGRYADPNAVGSSVFINCYMDDHIASEGWASMTGTQKSGPAKTVFLPEDSRFFEYKSSGPGGKVTPARRQLSDAQASDYTVEKVLGDWKPR
ncbi:MAG TPA: pectinesterase family protein [Rhodocyclaceae bacterium]|nr:pectinesterase family protein [Rhodocyclaceae bacterium]